VPTNAVIAMRNRPLQLGGAAHGVHHSREFLEQTVAGCLDDPPGVLADLRVDEFAASALSRSFVPSSSALIRREGPTDWPLNKRTIGLGAPDVPFWVIPSADAEAP